MSRVSLTTALPRRYFESLATRIDAAAFDRVRAACFVLRSEFSLRSGVVIAGSEFAVTCSHGQRLASTVVAEFADGSESKGSIVANYPADDILLLHLEQGRAGAPISHLDDRLADLLFVTTWASPARRLESHGAVAIDTVGQSRLPNGARLLLGQRLLPGDSGLPVLDTHGRVAAIAHGSSGWRFAPNVIVALTSVSRLLRRAAGRPNHSTPTDRAADASFDAADASTSAEEPDIREDNDALWNALRSRRHEHSLLRSRALQVCERSDWKWAEFLDTLAMWHVAAHDVRRAVEVEHAAVRIAPYWRVLEFARRLSLLERLRAHHVSAGVFWDAALGAASE